MPPTEDEYVLFGTGVFTGAILSGDPQHMEARHLVKAERERIALAY
jgi:hypothetical protein